MPVIIWLTSVSSKALSCSPRLFCNPSKDRCLLNIYRAPRHARSWPAHPAPSQTLHVACSWPQHVSVFGFIKTTRRGTPALGSSCSGSLTCSFCLQEGVAASGQTETQGCAGAVLGAGEQRGSTTGSLAMGSQHRPGAKSLGDFEWVSPWPDPLLMGRVLGHLIEVTRFHFLLALFSKSSI